MYKIFNILFLITLVAIPFVPDSGRIDIVGPQFLFMSWAVVIKLFIDLIYFKHLKIKLNSSLLFYIAFLGIAFVSIFFSFNKVSATIEYCRYFITFSYLLIYYNILLKERVKIKSIILFVLIFASIESLYIFYIFLDNYDFLNPPTRLRALQGLAYNQNVASLSILAKIPIIIYSFLKQKSKTLSFIVFILFCLSFFNLLILATRSALLGIILIISLIFVALFLRKILKLNLFYPKRIFLIGVFAVLIAAFQTFLYKNSSSLKVLDRVSNLEDDSSNYRLNLWRDAIKMTIENPFTGIGIGNYKIESLRYNKDVMTKYEIPFHAHNDYLHIFSETGIFGGIFYLTVFIIPFVFFIKYFRFYHKEDKSFLVFLMLSIVAIGIDYFFNFPRYRPYSLVNFILVFSLFFFIISTYRKTSLSINKNFIFVLLAGGIFSLYILNRVNNSFKDQFPLYIEYNQYPDQIITPVSEILNFEDEIPNISTITIPLKLSKARYLFLDGRYDEAKKLIKAGRKNNPYLGFGDLLLTRIYLRENKLDSAEIYSERSIQKMPFNISHISYYQIIQEKKQDLENNKKIFEKTKHLMDETLWQNYLISTATIKLNKEIPFDDDEKEYSKLALEYFPNRKLIETADKIIQYGGSIIPVANLLDNEARQHFQNKEYEKAIEKWQRAIDLVPDDDAYYLNICHSYLLMDRLDKSLEYFKTVERKKLKSQDGKYEFLYAIYHIKKKNISEACKNALLSQSKGYNDSKRVLNQLNCTNF